MAYTTPQINDILAKADRTMYKTGVIAYQNMFSELDEALDYHRDIIYIYKKAVEWGDDYFVGTEKLDKIVERLAGMIAVWDYGMLTPIYNDVAGTEISALPPCLFLVDLCDVNITNVQDGQYLTYDTETSKWINTGPGGAIRYNESITATAGQTVFVTSNPFAVGLFDLYLNGVKLNSASYSTFGSYSITLVDAAVAGDILDITIYDNNASIASFLSLTTTGSTGASTLIGNILNVPNYGLESISSAAVSGTTTKTLTLTKLGGGTVTASWTDLSLPTLTAGSVVFSNGTTITEDNANFFWDDANNRLGIGTNAPTARLTVNGDTIISATASTTTIPRNLGIAWGASTEAARWYFGDALNSIQNSFSGRFIVQTYWGMSIYGGRISATPRGFETGLTTDWSLNVLGTQTANPVLVVTGATSQTGNLQQWRNSAGTVLNCVTASGRLLLGTTSELTYILDANGTVRIQSTVTLSSLAGTGSRMVIADASGVLSTQAITTGTVTSVDMSVPTGFSISGNPVTSTGTLALAFASGYSLPTNVKQSNWDDAYTWVAAFPSQTGNGGKYLTTDGSTLSWGDSIPGFEANFLLMGA